jgi:pyrroline-5-carboxylate reductase
MSNRLDRELAILGLGKLGGILVRGFVEGGLLTPDQIRATDKRLESASRVASRYNIQLGEDNVAAAEQADIILLCVRPKTVLGVVQEIGHVLREEQLLISVAASVSTSQIEEALPNQVPVVRAMPNTPCSVGCGMTAVCRGRFASDAHLSESTRLLMLWVKQLF